MSFCLNYAFVAVLIMGNAAYTVPKWTYYATQDMLQGYQSISRGDEEFTNK